MENAIRELAEVQDQESFLALLERRPEVLSDPETTIALTVLSDHFAHGPAFARWLSLIVEARISPEHAWEQYEASLAKLTPIEAKLSVLQSAISAADEARELGRIVELTDEAIELACKAGYGGAATDFLQRRGMALFNMGSNRRADELEEAVETLKQAVEAAVPGAQKASALMHLGMVTAERVHGDRAENLEHAIGTMRAALEELANVDDPAFSAMLRTNLAVTMYRRERGDRVSNLQEAADLCRSALDYRSPKRNADDWAYSQLNLANALDALAARGESFSEDAREAYLQVIEQEDAISERWLVGDAHHMLGRQGLWLAHRSAEEIVDDHAAGIEETDPTSILTEARDHLLRARDLTRHGSDRMRYGMILEALSDALVRLGEDDLAITVMQEALTILRPKSSPRPCATTAGRLGGFLSDRGQWRDAADAYRTAVEATEFTFHSRLDTASRETETRNSGNLHRWAAYAYARAGDSIEAALVLERGRARELRRRLVLTGLDDETAAGIPAGLRDELYAASEALLTASLDTDGSVEGRRLQEAVSAVRALPGLADFAAEVRWENVTAALEPGWPLIYVDPTPAGTLLLCIHMEGDSREPVADASFVEATSQELIALLMTGDAALAEDAAAEGVTPYLLGISGHGDGPGFQMGLNRTLSWLGERIARPLGDVLLGCKARGVTLILCGPIAATPIHAAPWRDNDGDRCLVDLIDIRHAPSALVATTAQRRARARQSIPPRLVALGDPERSHPKRKLPAAGAEVEEIVAVFADSSCAVGADAHRDFLLQHLESATHLHLACHAHGGLFDSSETAIFLASGELPATALTALGKIATRLVVVSACQSAISEIAGLPEEALSIATVMLAAGSACAIASLWEVDDLATALLMTKLYEEMLISGRRPPEALRRAQLWLRNLSEGDESRFFERHPALEAEFSRRAGTGDAPGQRGSSSGHTASGPYTHPEFWAPFIALGA